VSARGQLQRPGRNAAGFVGKLERLLDLLIYGLSLQGFPYHLAAATR
jgi:hypothetical protein